MNQNVKKPSPEANCRLNISSFGEIEYIPLARGGVSVAANVTLPDYTQVKDVPHHNK